MFRNKKVVCRVCKIKVSFVMCVLVVRKLKMCKFASSTFKFKRNFSYQLAFEIIFSDEYLGKKIKFDAAHDIDRTVI